MRSDGTLSSSGTSGNATAYDPTNNAADGLWDKFLSKHPNISMIICGHSDVDGVIVNKQIADHGNEVTQILVNPQTMDAEYYHGSKGMVAMLYFSADGQNVQVEYYSTIKGTYYPCDDFTLSYSSETHNFSADVTAPDCEHAGYTTYTCPVCEYGYVSDHTDALGHTEMTLEAKDPTCTETGLTAGKSCSACGIALEPQETIPAKGHFEVFIPGVAPTCTSKGFTDGVGCTICDTVLSGYTEIPANGHSYEDVVTAPTCENAGYTTYTCSACGDSYTDSETVALGHKYVGAQTLAPTCTEKGVKTYTCQNDASHTYTEEIASLGHSYNSEVTAPTCESAGFTTYTCSVCNHSYTDDETEALGHTAELVSGKAPTCTETGLTDGSKCSVCGETLLAQNTIPANGHSDVEPKDFICDVCDADLCTEHNEEIIEAVAPTCTESGLSEGKRCSICGDVLLAQETVPALGHSYETVVTAPTCTEAGYTTYTCSVCGDSYVADETAALGHRYETVVTAPTCTEAGYTTYTCSVCGDSYVADETEALGHSYETVVTAPTCTEAGYTTYTCSVCGDSYVADETAALGHSYETVVTAPTCTEAGYTTYTCSVCGDSYVADETEALGHTWTPATTESPETCEKCGETRSEKLPEETTPDEEPETEPSEKDEHSECAPKSKLDEIVFAILNFIRLLFGLSEQCYCGKVLN